MKRHTNFTLPVEIGLDLNSVREIKIVFDQSGTRLYFVYPSENAVRESQEKNVILLRWSAADTNQFIAGRKIRMDTHIRLTGSEDNPETEIVELMMSPTLFTLEEVEDDD